jgi:hypothetical protein
MLITVNSGVGTFVKEKKLEVRRRSQGAWIAFWTLADYLWSSNAMLALFMG